MTCQARPCEVSGGPAASLDAVLGAVSAEASLARAKFERLQGAMGELILHCPADRRAAVMADVQLVDALAQHLEAISAFTGELARTSGVVAALQVEAALDMVTLAEVRGRLTRLCDLAGAAPHEPAGEPGDFDLF